MPPFSRRRRLLASLAAAPHARRRPKRSAAPKLPSDRRSLGQHLAYAPRLTTKTGPTCSPPSYAPAPTASPGSTTPPRTPAAAGRLESLCRQLSPPSSPATLTRPAAFAYWANLYNALTVQLVLRGLSGRQHQGGARRPVQHRPVG